MAIAAIAPLAPVREGTPPINADWRVGLLAGVLTSAGFSVWLPFWSRRRQVDLTDAFSLTNPFLPINRYPIRAWLLLAASMALAGAIGVIASTIFGRGNSVVGGIYLGMGAPLFATLVLWGVRRS